MDSKTPPKNSSSLSSLLGPGFRFHPTDEELVQFYLRRKVIGKSFRFDAITDVDVYKTEPWDLPYMSKLKTRDLEWYFFSFLDKKYGNGARTNRATGKGYWKTTGKDRAVYHRKQVVGMKKTLVYHSGRAPKGQRTNWVMHEYRLIGSELETGGVAQDAFVLCRIFQKSGSGPKNGEQYGAPFVDEEWDNDDALDLVPQHDATAEIDFGDNVCFNSDELQQIPGSDVLSNVALPVSSQSADGSHVGEATSFGSTQDHLVSAGAYHCESTMCYQQNVQTSPASFDMDVTPVKKDCIGECSKSGNSDDFNFLLNDPFLDSFDYFPNADEGFIEANDLAKPFETSNAFDMLEEYLDASDDSSFCLACDPEMLFGSDDLFSNQTLLPHTDMGNGSEQAILPMGQLINDINSDAAIPPDKPGLTEYQSDFQYPFIKKASGMLGNVQAPPAFAAEFPPKDAILRLNSVARPRKSVDVSADTVQIRNSDVSGKGTKQSPRKHENFKLVLCFGFWRGDGGSSSVFPGKTLSATYRGWLCLSVFWILILSMGFRIGTYIGFK